MRLASVPRDAAPSEVLADMARLTRPEALVLVVAPPDGTLRIVDGRKVSSPILSEALAQGLGTVRLPRPAAANLGLPERTAMAGIARVDAGASGSWGVIVVASAERVRDREQHGRMRLILAVAMAAGLVLGFGGLALRQQRKELLLGRELASQRLRASVTNAFRS